MSNCSQHEKDILGISDMKVIARMIGDLHYETLHALLFELSNKIYNDATNDAEDGRQKLDKTSYHLKEASMSMKEVWQISKPFMIK